MDVFEDFVLPDDTLEDWNRRRERMRARVMSYFGSGPDLPSPLDPEIGEPESRDGFTRTKVSYQVEDGQRAPALLFVPERLSGPAPVVLCYHGTSKPGKDAVTGARANSNYAEELARRGYVTLAPDQWATGERAGVDDEFLLSGNFYRRHPEWSIEGKTAWDHMRALDFLETVEEADTSRTGATGLSRGGRATLYHMLHDERVTAGVPVCGAPPYRSEPRLGTMAQRDEFIAVPRAHEEIKNGKQPGYDIHEVFALIAPRAVLFVSPFVDQFAPHGRTHSDLAEKVAALYRFLGKGNNFSRYAHGEGHHTGPILRAAIYAWFDYHLKGKVPDLPGWNLGRHAPGVDGSDDERWNGIIDA